RLRRGSDPDGRLRRDRAHRRGAVTMRGTPQASVFTRLPRGIFALIGLVSVAAVGGALLAQYGFDIKPCPWCVLQRLIFLVIALVCLIGWLWRARASCTLSALGVLVRSACGVAAAVF